jgi:biopolymer transport protein TolR
MAEINVTPFVDVMLVLLIIFMVAAPLLTVGVPIELPASQGKELQAESDGEPLTISVNPEGRIFLQETEIALDELQPRLAAIMQARGKADEAIFVRGDRNTNYGELMRVMGRIAAAGYRKISLVTELEEAR